MNVVEASNSVRSGDELIAITLMCRSVNFMRAIGFYVMDKSLLGLGFVPFRKHELEGNWDFEKIDQKCMCSPILIFSFV